MDLLSAVDQILTAGGSLISMHPINCLHTIDRLNTCNVCTSVCPVDAISLQGGLNLDAEKCVNCGLCLRLCPVGAFDGEDGVEDLFRCVQVLGKLESIELCCNRHPAPDFGAQNVRVVLKTDRCLGSFGPSVFLSLLVMGIHKISLRLDACSACQVSKTCQHTIQAARSVNTFFSSYLEWPKPVVEIVTENQQSDWTQRPVVDVKRPPMSRKSFLTNLFSPPSLAGVGRFVNETTAPDSIAPQPSRERQRLAKALSLYREIITKDQGGSLDQFIPVADLRVADTCTACGVCATICRTGALDFVEDGHNHFSLLFSPAKCAGCGVCREYCEAGAISLSSSLEEWNVDKNRMVLDAYAVISGELQRCERCHVPFRKRVKSSLQSAPVLCPVCDFRRSNPFGFSLPRNTALLQKTR